MTAARIGIGYPGSLGVEAAAVLRSDLLALWQNLHGALGPVEDDIEALRQWFDPVAQGERLRREIAALPLDPPLHAGAQPPLVLPIDEGRTLITPEGRAALELLPDTSAGGSQVAWTPDTTLERELEVLLLDTYRRWSRHRITGVMRLLNGEDKPLQVPAAGLVLALLVNRSTSPDRAIIRFRAGRRRQEVDDAFFAPVAAFTQVLAPKTRADPTKWRLISGWISGEARRRLGESVVIERERADRDGRIYLREADQETILDTLARDLRRGHRMTVDGATLAEAFDALVVAFRISLPALAGYGLVHERPTDTGRLRLALLSRLQESGTLVP